MSQCLTACNPDLIQGVHETEFDTVTLLNMSNFLRRFLIQLVCGFYKQYGKNNLCRRLSDCVTDDQICYFSPTTLSADCQLVKGRKKER